jgi:coproporphyrinogen III oxidase-like Fe-S oxidoreductase
MARYEISNFSFAGANSIHNRVYRSYGERLWLGTSASGTYTNLTGAKVRTIGTHIIADYIRGDYLDDSKTQILTDDDVQYEKLILALRTQEGLEWVLYDETLRDRFFVEGRASKLDIYTTNDLMTYTDTRLALTDSGMNVYNTIVTELMK